VARWLRDDLREAVAESLSPERLRSQGLFDSRGVAKLLAEHNSGARDHRKQLWALFAFQQWHHEWFERPRGRVIPAVDATHS
jgi:asparagine synthase (glutamine-hydrolysing)